jgi:hypothetical protein
MSAMNAKHRGEWSVFQRNEITRGQLIKRSHSKPIKRRNSDKAGATGEHSHPRFNYTSKTLTDRSSSHDTQLDKGS